MFRLASKKCVEIQIQFNPMYFPNPFQIRAMKFYQFCMNYFTFTKKLTNLSTKHFQILACFTKI